MRPRTLVIVGVVMFVGAVVLRFLVVQFGLLPVSEEVVLKKAVALKVTFFDSTLVPVGNGKAKAFANPRKSVWIDDPAEVSEALAALHMKADGEDARYQPGWIWCRAVPNPNPHIEIEFKFNEKQSRTHSFEGSNAVRLDGYFVDREFRNVIREIVKRHVGHDFDDPRQDWDAINGDMKK